MTDETEEMNYSLFTSLRVLTGSVARYHIRCTHQVDRPPKELCLSSRLQSVIQIIVSGLPAISFLHTTQQSPPETRQYGIKFQYCRSPPVGPVR